MPRISPTKAMIHGFAIGCMSTMKLGSLNGALLSLATGACIVATAYGCTKLEERIDRNSGSYTTLIEQLNGQVYVTEAGNMGLQQQKALVYLATGLFVGVMAGMCFQQSRELLPVPSAETEEQPSIFLRPEL